MISRITCLVIFAASAIVANFAKRADGADRSSLRDAAERILNSPRFRDLKPLKRRPKMFRGDPTGNNAGPPQGEEYLDPNGNPVIVRDDKKRGQMWEDGQGKRRAVIFRDEEGRDIILRDDRTGKEVIVRRQDDDTIVRDDRGRPIIFRDKDGNTKIKKDLRGRAIIGRDERNREVILRDGQGRQVEVREFENRDVLQRDAKGRPVVIRDRRGQRVRIRHPNGDPVVHRGRRNEPIIYRDQDGRVEIQQDKDGRPILGRDENGRKVIARGNGNRDFVVRGPGDKDKVVRDDQGRPVVRPDDRNRVPIQRKNGRAVLGQDDEGRDVFLKDQFDRPVLAREEPEMDRLRERWRQGFRGPGGNGGNGDGGRGGNDNGGNNGGGNLDGNNGGGNNGGVDNPDPPVENDVSPSSTPDMSSSAGAMGSFFSVIAQVIGWMIVAVVVCVMVYLIVQGIMSLVAWYRDREQEIPATANTSAVDDDPIQPEHSPGDLPADVYIAKAQEYAAAGRFREAIAQLLLGGMSNLERAGLVKFRKGLTHRDYVRAIRGQPQYFQAMKAMVRLYEPLGFGRRTPSNDQFQQALAAYQAGFRATT